MAGRLAGKRIIITGAADNIGKEAARLFVAEGARVVIGDIDSDKGEATAAELGPAAHFIRVDLGKDAAILSFIEVGVSWPVVSHTTWPTRTPRRRPTRNSRRWTPKQPNSRPRQSPQPVPRGAARLTSSPSWRDYAIRVS